MKLKIVALSSQEIRQMASKRVWVVKKGIEESGT